LDGGRITHHDDMHSILLDGIATKQTHYRDWKNTPKLRLYMSTNATHTIKELAHALRLAQRWMQPPDPDHAELDARYTKDVETIARARANAKGKKAAQRSLNPHRLNR
jgi:ABC-type nitrate/sulfonate/bicarbonate transport system substrate-binding protein